MQIEIRSLSVADIDGVIALQRACFPPPFPEELLWQKEHLQEHLNSFPAGQFVAVDSSNGQIVGSASALRISEQRWQAHAGWEETLGGFFFTAYDPHGTTLYGADISVHPSYQKMGIGKRLYEARFKTVRSFDLVRYGTACRIPDYQATNQRHGGALPIATYCKQVANGALLDRTLSPLIRMGLTFLAVIEDYMDDTESGNAAALLEWHP
jgi:ribosomal protein S18 acetylase RimI-like enzyme